MYMYVHDGCDTTISEVKDNILGDLSCIVYKDIPGTSVTSGM